MLIINVNHSQSTATRFFFSLPLVRLHDVLSLSLILFKDCIARMPSKWRPKFGTLKLDFYMLKIRFYLGLMLKKYNDLITE